MDRTWNKLCLLLKKLLMNARIETNSFKDKSYQFIVSGTHAKLSLNANRETSKTFSSRSTTSPPLQ